MAGKSIILSAASSLLLACGGEPPDAERPPTADTPQATPASSPVILAPGEVVLADTARSIPLGTDRDEVGRLLDPLFGEPVHVETDAPCDAGPSTIDTHDEGLLLYYRDDRLIGWFVDREAGGDLRTRSGIGLGSTLAELNAAQSDVRVFESSLGTEFEAGLLAGTLSVPGPRGRITVLWSGDACIVR
jgi:hypothetical protein